MQHIFALTACHKKSPPYQSAQGACKTTYQNVSRLGDAPKDSACNTVQSGNQRGRVPAGKA